jgi:hypothetical protein
MTCIWTRLNVCRDGLYDMLLGWTDTDDLPPYEHRCALLRLETLVKRSIACIMFIFDIFSGRLNSPYLLSAPDLNIGLGVPSFFQLVPIARTTGFMN